LRLLVVESVDTSSQEEREKVLEKRSSKTKVELLELTLRSVQTGVISVEQSFHDEAKVDVRGIDTSDSNEAGSPATPCIADTARRRCAARHRPPARSAAAP